MDTDSKDSKVIVSGKDFFREVVGEAFVQRKIKASPFAEQYLIQLLEHFLTTANLYQEDLVKGGNETLAEMFLKASSADPSAKTKILKRLGDTALYISGFFGESLSRKTVAVEYYVQMGSGAYGSLASVVREDTFKSVFREFSERFVDFVDALAYISDKARDRSENSTIFYLFEHYEGNGSEWARDELAKRGYIPTFGKTKVSGSED